MLVTLLRSLMETPASQTHLMLCPWRSVTGSCLIHDFSYTQLRAHACLGSLFLLVLRLLLMPDCVPSLSEPFCLSLCLPICLVFMTLHLSPVHHGVEEQPEDGDYSTASIFIFKWTQRREPLYMIDECLSTSELFKHSDWIELYVVSYSYSC